MNPIAGHKKITPQKRVMMNFNTTYYETGVRLCKGIITFPPLNFCEKYFLQKIDCIYFPDRLFLELCKLVDLNARNNKLVSLSHETSLDYLHWIEVNLYFQIKHANLILNYIFNHWRASCFHMWKVSLSLLFMSSKCYKYSTCQFAQKFCNLMYRQSPSLFMFQLKKLKLQN